MTRRLLAYGRRQVLQPEILNVNDVVRALEPMLWRTSATTSSSSST